MAALRVDIGEWKRNTEAWKQTANRKSRRVLNTHVLRQIFDLRARTLRARVALPPREQREAAFRDVSPSYVAAVAQGPAVWGECAHQMRIRDLNWWMPVVRPRPGGPSANRIAKQRFPYRALTQTRELAVGGIMLDIGANIGRMSISRVVLGDVVAAYCAEPDPLNYACLVGNIVDNDLNGLLMPDRLAIADRDGTMVLRRADVPGGHRLLPDKGAIPAAGSQTPGAGSQKGDLVEVPCLTLDSWLARLRVDTDAVTFVKVDVQGFEMRVLRGASSLLARRHVAWQLEVDEVLLAKGGTSIADLCAELRQHFTHFIDMSGVASGSRYRAIDELPEGLAYLAGSASKTDVLLYSSTL